MYPQPSKSVCKKPLLVYLHFNVSITVDFTSCSISTQSHKLPSFRNVFDKLFHMGEVYFGHVVIIGVSALLVKIKF